jgi:hypothetical protein
VKQIALAQYNRSAMTTKIAKQRRSTIDARQPAATMTLSEAMRALEQAGSEQTRKTYARHGATGPMFGVSVATLKQLVKRIGVDHELALELWSTGNDVGCEARRSDARDARRAGALGQGIRRARLPDVRRRAGRGESARAGAGAQVAGGEE